MHQTLIILLFILIPIWLVTTSFRLMSVPLKTEIPSKFGTILIVYGILIPIIPLLIVVCGWQIDISKILVFFISDGKALTAINIDRWVKICIEFYFLTLLISLLFSFIYKKSLKNYKNKVAKLLSEKVIWLFEKFDIVDETQLLLSQSNIQIDILQNDTVYCGEAYPDSFSTSLFGSKTITLKTVIKIPLAKANSPSPGFPHIAGMRLKEMKFPIDKITNYNVRHISLKGTQSLLDRINRKS